MESKNMTPASSSRKRRSTTNAMSSDTEQTPTKQRQTSAKRTKGKLQEDTMRINLGFIFVENLYLKSLKMILRIHLILAQIVSFIPNH
jgi:hypothetical protein